MQNHGFQLLALASVSFFLVGCSQEQTDSKKGAGSQTAEQERVQSSVKNLKAIAGLSATKEGQVRGIVTFTVVDNGVEIVADIEGLTPGKHGFHIHEHGDCSTPDASSAGGHFNPTNKKHGSPDSEERHVGDLGNIEADEHGIAHYERIDSVITLNGVNSIIGRGVIVHEKADDFKTQPTGDSGARVACGVIEVVE